MVNADIGSKRLAKMDLQDTINAYMAQARKESLANSDQLTLGELILKLDAIPNKEASLVFDFGYFYPTCVDSWRGAYEELALNYQDTGSSLNVHEFLVVLKQAIGDTFTGYKGGDFKMNKHTPLWVSNYGHSNNTAVVDILDKNYQVIIITGYREY